MDFFQQKNMDFFQQKSTTHAKVFFEELHKCHMLSLWLHVQKKF